VVSHEAVTDWAHHSCFVSVVSHEARITLQ
jgi:hypothetical protein